MFDYSGFHNVLKTALDHGAEAANLRETDDGNWLSVYDAFSQLGYANNTQAYDFFDKKFPSITKHFKQVRFSGKGHHHSWGFRKKHLKPLAGIFGVLAARHPELPPSTEPPESEPPTPTEQFAFSEFRDLSLELPYISEDDSDYIEIPELNKISKKALERIINLARVEALKSVRILQEHSPRSLSAVTSPYGWLMDLDGEIEMIPEEILILREMEMLFCEHKDHQKVSALLNEKGFTNRDGRSWREEEVKEILLYSPRFWIRWAKKKCPELF